MIRRLSRQQEPRVDVEDDGTVMISGTNAVGVTKAVEWVKGLTREVHVDEEFEGSKAILPFGAFVEILPGKEGMVHVSQMSTEFVGAPTDVVQIGQKCKVRVMEIDDQHRVNLSMLFGEDAKNLQRERRDRASASAYCEEGIRSMIEVYVQTVR